MMSSNIFFLFVSVACYFNFNPFKMCLLLILFSGLMFYKIYIYSSLLFFSILYFLLFMGGIILIFMVLSSLFPNEKMIKSKNLLFILCFSSILFNFIYMLYCFNGSLIGIMMFLKFNYFFIMILVFFYFFCFIKMISYDFMTLRSLKWILFCFCKAFF